MRINMLMRSSKVKRSRNVGKSENLTVAPTITCQMIDSFIVTFVMHRNVKKIILIVLTCISGPLMLTTLHNINWKML